MLKRRPLRHDQGELFHRVYEQIEAEQREVNRLVDGEALAATIIAALNGLGRTTGPDLLVAVRLRRDEFVPRV
jgi:hypothetical protein